MNVAQQFMNQLQEGKTTEAIKTIKEALHERSAEKIQEEKQDILESYGFVVKEANVGSLIATFDDGKSNIITNGKGREMLLKFAKKYFDYEEWNDLVSVDEDTAEDIVDEIIVTLDRKGFNSRAMNELEKLTRYTK